MFVLVGLIYIHSSGIVSLSSFGYGDTFLSSSFNLLEDMKPLPSFHHVTD